MPTRLCLVLVGGLALLAAPSAVFGQRGTGSLGASSRGASSLGGSNVSAASSGIPTLSGSAQVSSSDRFVRDGRQAGAFVGTDSADTREFIGQVGAGASGTQRGMQGLGGRTAGRGQTANRGRNTGRSAEIRSAIQVGFGYRAPDGADLGAILVGRLERSNRIRTPVPLEVAVVEGTAILRGVVATPYDRALAEQLVRLEPGIRQVQNELSVQAAATFAEPGPTMDPFAPATVARPSAGAP